MALITTLLCSMQLHAQLRFTVKVGPYGCTDLPVAAALDTLPEGPWELKETTGNKELPTPFQTSPGKIWWQLNGVSKPGTTRTYELVRPRGKEIYPVAVMEVTEKDGLLTLSQGGQPRMQYHAATMKAPVGIDSVYQRSGFIHPLWAPDGQVLTNIQPKAHYHHYGIWNPWTHTLFKGKETDFWNLQKKEGRVRFAGYISRTTGPVWCGFKALQEHLAGEEKALSEVWDIRVYNYGKDSSRYIWDFTSTLSCADIAGITLLQYRYGGGFGLRATADWKAGNTQVLTDAGHTRNDTDSTRARWIKITGRTDKGQAGMLILCAPDNFDAPQPLRLWPDNSEHGEIMLNYSPTKMREWRLAYGKEYRQRYRVMVYEGDISPGEAAAAWQNFAYPPKITSVLVPVRP